MTGSEVRRAASTITPLPTSSPATEARDVFGTAPMPTTTRSAGSCAPDEVIAAATRPAAPRTGLRLDHRPLTALLARGRRHLQADPAGPDHDYLACLGQRGSQPLRVRHRAEVPDAAEITARYIQRARRGAGGEKQPVVGDR